MSRRPSKQLKTIIDSIEGGTAPYGGLLDQIKALRDELQKEEAEASRGFQQLSKYHEVKIMSGLYESSRKLTGKAVK